MEAPDPRLEAIARELNRLGETQEEDARRLREWILRLDAEMERIWNELGLRRASRK